MEDNGNLLDSLCWVVSFDGKKVGSGYYRKEIAKKESYLHSLFPADVWEMYPVNGHALASLFIREHAKKSEKGQWRVYFAILAPYWGYWEVGHRNVLTRHFEKFAVMAETWDDVKRDLKPATVEFYRSRPNYFMPNKPSLKGSSFERRRENLGKSPWKEKAHYDRWPNRRDLKLKRKRK